MENTNKTTPTLELVDGKAFDFNLIGRNFMAVLNPAVELFKKDPTNFILIFAIPVIVGGLLSQIVMPMLLGGLLYGGFIGLLLSTVIFFICSVVLSLLAYLALVKAVIDKTKHGKIDIGGAFSFASKHIVDSVVLSVKAFLTIFSGFKKFINSMMSLIYFMESATPNVDAAIKQSQENCEGKSYTVLWNLFLIGIATSIASSIIVSVWVGITGRFSYELASLGSSIASGLISSFTVLFQYTFKQEVEKLKK